MHGLDTRLAAGWRIVSADAPRKKAWSKAESCVPHRTGAGHRGHCINMVLRMSIAVTLMFPLLNAAAGAKVGRGQAQDANDGGTFMGGGLGERGAGDREVRAEDTKELYDQFCGAALVEKGTGQVDQAVQLLGSTISQMPNITVCWFELGIILGSLRDVNLAQRCLRTAARLDRHERKAYALIHELQRSGQLPPISPSIEFESDANDPAVKHQNRYKRRLYERYYYLDCRMRRLQQTLNEKPHDVPALLGVAEVSSELLYHREAVDMLQRALAVEPDNGAVFVKLVEAQVKGCVFKNWDDNFLRLEEFILRQAAAGKPVVLGPIQSTMYPLPPNVGLAICKQGGAQAHAAVVQVQPVF